MISDQWHFWNFNADMTVGEWNGSLVLSKYYASGGFLDKALNINHLNFEVTNALAE